MKKRTITLLYVFCCLIYSSTINGQNTVETFESFADGATSFTNSTSGVSFDITGNWTMNEFTGLAIYNSDFIIDNESNCLGSAGVVGSISTTDGSGIFLDSFWIFPSHDCSILGTSGNVLIRGKKGGVTQYTLTVLSASLNTSQSTNNGFTFVDNAANSSTEIDEVEVEVTGSIRYIAIDNFSFSSQPRWNGASWFPSAPGASDDAFINGSYNTSSGNLSVTDLTITSGNTLTMGTGSISLTGNFDNNGNAFAQTGGTFTFNGSSLQQIEGTNSFDDIVINNASGVQLQSQTNVTGVLTLTNGNFVSGGNLILNSTSASAGGTATVSFGGGAVTGNVVQKRFLDGATQDGYRYVAAAVASQTLAGINDDITLNRLGSVFSPSTNVSTYIRGYGAPIPNIFHYDQSLVMSGTIGSGSLNGQSFDDAELGWEIPSATSDAFNPGSGIALNTGTSDITLDFTGILQSLNVVLSLAHGGQTNSGWHLVGNPFAATLDWNAVYEDGDNSGVDPTAYVFDANDTYTGTYASFNAATDAGVNGGTKNIASGQAFFIQTTSGMTGDVTMKTSHTLSTDVQFFKTTESNWEGELRLKLADDQGKEDELLLYFIEDAQEGKDVGDAKKFFGTSHGSPELASNAFGFPLLMDCRKPLEGNEIQSFDLTVKSGKVGIYTLKTSTIDKFPIGTEIFLEDHYENVLIDLSQISEYSFVIDEEESMLENRFQVHIRINRVTALEDDLAERGVALFAHSKQVNVQFANSTAANSQIAVYDLMGRRVFHQANDKQLKINIPIQHRGIYVVKVENGNGIITKRVMIK